MYTCVCIYLCYELCIYLCYELHIFTKQAYQRKHGRHLESNPQALCTQGNHQEGAPTPFPSSYCGATSGSLSTNGLVSIAKSPSKIGLLFLTKRATLCPCRQGNDKEDPYILPCVLHLFCAPGDPLMYRNSLTHPYVWHDAYRLPGVVCSLLQRTCTRTHTHTHAHIHTHTHAHIRTHRHIPWQQWVG